MSNTTKFLAAAIFVCGVRNAPAQLLQPNSVQPVFSQAEVRSTVPSGKYRLIQAAEPVPAEVSAPDPDLPPASEPTPAGDPVAKESAGPMTSEGGCSGWNEGCSAGSCGCSSTVCGTALGCRKCCRCGLFGGDGLGIDWGGWLAGGTTYNSHGLSTPNGNAPLGFNNYANGWVLNQAWLYAERAADTGGCGFDWGFRADFMFGADGPDTVAFGDLGWDYTWQTSGQYGFAMPQLYGEVMFNKTKVKIGHFYTIIGYEVVQAPDNFFYSHALTFYYNEPFTHTGFLAERPIGENVTGYAGWTMGWDSGFGNDFGGSTFLGGLSTRLTEDINLIWATTFGDRGFGADTYMQSIVADVALTESTNYIFQTDWQQTDFGAGNEDAYGINQYLIKTLNDRWAVGTRLEWLRDDSNQFNGPGSYWDWTVGANYTGRRGVVNRFEARYDWFDGVARPYAQNTKRSQLSVGWSSYFTF